VQNLAKIKSLTGPQYKEGDRNRNEKMNILNLKDAKLTLFNVHVIKIKTHSIQGEEPISMCTCKL